MNTVTVTKTEETKTRGEPMLGGSRRKADFFEVKELYDNGLCSRKTYLEAKTEWDKATTKTTKTTKTSPAGKRAREEEPEPAPELAPAPASAASAQETKDKLALAATVIKELYQTSALLKKRHADKVHASGHLSEIYALQLEMDHANADIALALELQAKNITLAFL